MPIRPMPPKGLNDPQTSRESQTAQYLRETAEREHLEQTNPRVVVVMVHGTFARKAKWVEPDSAFGAGLRQALAPALVVPCRWSGGNSVRARAEGVERLRSDIAELRRQHPKARFAIVAHSHGGNVALTALADEALARTLIGVATLGTPFLSATLRPIESLLEPVDGFVAALFAGIAVFAVGAALGHGRQWWLPALLTFLSVGIALAVASFTAGRMRNHAKGICDLMPPTQLTPDQLAIVRTSSDEAAAALSGARVAGGFASIFWSMATSGLVEMLQRTLHAVDYFGTRALEDQVLKKDGPRVGGFGADVSPLGTSSRAHTLKSLGEDVLRYLPLLVLTMLDDGNAWVRWLGAVLAVFYGLPALVALLVSLVSIPFSVVFALGLLPCGWTLPLAGPYLDLTAEPAPPGTWSVTQLRGGAEGALSHGRSHDDPAAIARVCTWLKDRLVEAEKGKPATV